jgi:hypothetical protein
MEMAHLFEINVETLQIFLERPKKEHQPQNQDYSIDVQERIAHNHSNLKERMFYKILSYPRHLLVELLS